MVLSYGCMWNSCESFLVHFKAGQNPNKSTMLKKKMLAKLNAGLFSLFHWLQLELNHRDLSAHGACFMRQHKSEFPESGCLVFL